jgi:flavin-dependent dehydrogenase
MGHNRGGHAVVIGGSVAGLLSARALSEHYDHVTIIERDELPDGPAMRKGVPQGRHLHTFWAGGLEAVERLMPGIRAELTAAGGVPLNLPTDVAWLVPGNRWTTQFPATQQLASASRPLLEWVVRTRVLKAANIDVLTHCDVTGLRGDAGEVTGVVVAPRDGGDSRAVDADMVIDAGGRGSRLSDWLGQLGHRRPEETVIDAHIGYATRVYAIPAAHDDRWKAAYVQAAPPRHQRGGIMFPIEGDRWIVTLIGGGGDYPPTDEEGFLDHARSLRSPLIHDAIAGAVPLTPIVGYRRTANQRRFFEKSGLPSGLVALGDSLCAFNPAYGQGMTVAALQAVELDAVLRSEDSSDRRRLTRRIQKRVARCVEGPWLLCTGSDLRFTGTTGAKANAVTRLQHRYLDRVLAAAASDAHVNAAFLRVLNMLDAPTALFRPGVAVRAMSPAGRPASTVPAPPFAVRQQHAGLGA